MIHADWLNINCKHFLAVVVISFLSACSFVIAGDTNVAYASTAEQTNAYRNLFTTKSIPEESNRHLYMSTNAPTDASGNYVPTLAFYVYKKSTDPTVDLKLNNISGGCGASSRFDKMRLYKISGGNDKADGPALEGSYDDLKSNCSKSGSTITLSLTGSYFQQSQIYGSDYSFALVYLRLKSDETEGFDISVGGAPLDGPKLSLIGDRNGNSIKNKTFPSGVYEYSEYAPSITRSTGGMGSTKVTFSPPCDATNEVLKNRRVRWKDADSGKPPNENVSVDYSVNGSPARSGDAGHDRKNFVSSDLFNVSRGGTYTLAFNPVSAATSNTIQILLPFNQAPCIPPPSVDWRVETDSYIQRNSSGDFGSSVGSFDEPDGPNAPQPGHAFRYVTSAQNSDSSSKSITGPYTTSGDSYNNGTYNFLNFGNKCLPGQPASGPCSGSLYANTAGNIKFNKQLVDNYNPDPDPGANEYRGYTTAIGGVIAEPWGYNWGEFTVAASDGGRQRCVVTTISPTLGDRKSGDPYDAPSGSTPDTNERWTYSGSDTSTLCVNVPFYYNLTPSLTIAGSNTVQQGDAVDVDASIANPGQTSGRNHTDSESGKNKGVAELVIPSGTAEPSDKTANGTSGLNPCDYMKSKVAGATCNQQGNVTVSVAAGGSEDIINDGRASTSTLPVGTKLCYVAYAQHPKNTTSGDVGAAGDGVWSYSTIVCKTVVKKPKVQFNNTDVTVGRYQTQTTGCPDAASAPIITAESPNGVSPSNLYGSWVEYGAFATSYIRGFGSGATPFGISPNQPHRLTFGNNNLNPSASNLGGFVYNKNCSANVFGLVKDSNSTNLIGLADDTIFNRTTGTLDMQKLDPAKDKTGYVASGKSVLIGTPTASGPSDSGGVTVLDQYSISVTVEAWAKATTDDKCEDLDRGTNLIVSLNDDMQSKTIECFSVDDKKQYTFTFDLSENEDVTSLAMGLGNDYGKDVSLKLGAISYAINRNGVRAGEPSISFEYPVRGAFDKIDLSDFDINLYKDFECKFVDNQPLEIGFKVGDSKCAGIVSIDALESIINQDLDTARGVPPTSVSTPPPLTSDFTGFNSRTIVVYAKKTSPGDCSTTSDGNLTINQNIVFKRDGFNNITEIPRIVFMADCNITINDSVTEVNASLFAKYAIKTCAGKVTTQDKCNQRLTVRGAISAEKLLLWRTYGADLSTGAPDPRLPAETFELSPSQVVSGFMRGLRSATPTTVYEADLPPRY